MVMEIQNAFMYRINLLMWRVRNILRFLTVFFFCQAAFVGNSHIFGYNSQQMATYNLLGILLWSFIFATRTADLAPNIATGEMANMLVKPMSVIKFWAAREVGDKINNIVFTCFEFTILLLIFRSAFLVPQNLYQVIFFALLIFMAMVLNFFLNFLVALITFWYREGNGWPMRFLYDMTLTVLSGTLLPLDMFPKQIQKLLYYLPSSYLYFAPIQVWLGKIQIGQYLQLLSITFFWIGLTYFLIKLTWSRGIKIYESEGR
jgi:ABC-2 type transport system permease protein